MESQDSQGKINLRATIADRDNCIGYAYAEIELQKPVDAVLLLGVDDSEKIWVNGSRVFEQFTARGLTVDQDRVPVHLEPEPTKRTEPPFPGTTAISAPASRQLRRNG